MGARLGQHFLTSPVTLRAIITAAHPKQGDTVLEIGPGRGVLTRALLQTGATVIAVEKDEELARALCDALSEEKHFRMVTGDIRDTDATKLGLPDGYLVAANIPYYITGAIIRQFLTAKNQPSRMVLLTQREVAERIAHSKKESLLSLSVKAYGEPKLVARVPRGAFSPVPKVDSAILAIEDISRKKFIEHGVSEEAFFELLHVGFAQKRKMLASNLSPRYGRAAVMRALTAAGLHEKVRAEDVALEEWLTIAKVTSLHSGVGVS